MLKRILLYFLWLFYFQLFFSESHAQQRTDSLVLTQPKAIDTTNKTKNILSTDTSAKKYNPRIATFRSLILPGWGQATNKKYWKIPIVYGALGSTAAIFFYNLKTYKQLRQAYIYISDTIPSNDALINSEFKNLSPESLRSYRNSFRQNVDYSVLFFLFFWGLNVVDATVDSHLKTFDVSNDISMKIKPVLNSRLAGVSIVVFMNNNKAKTLSSLP